MRLADLGRRRHRNGSGCIAIYSYTHAPGADDTDNAAEIFLGVVPDMAGFQHAAREIETRFGQIGYGYEDIDWHRAPRGDGVSLFVVLACNPESAVTLDAFDDEDEARRFAELPSVAHHSPRVVAATMGVVDFERVGATTRCP